MKVPPQYGVAVLALLAFVTAGCQDEGNGAAAFEGLPKNQIPGENTAEAATLDPGNELALVSLVFPRVEASGIEAVEGSTHRAIGFEAKNSENLLAVTLRLTLNQRSEPHLRFFTEPEEKSFRGIVTPTHSLETFADLEFGGPTVVLRDHGTVDIVINEGESVTLSPQDMVTLWNGCSLVLSARARIVNNGEAGLFQLRIKPEGGLGYVTQGAQLLETKMFPADSHESMGLMVTPSTCSPIELEVIRSQ
jgi:hypothetical protein